MSTQSLRKNILQVSITSFINGKICYTNHEDESSREAKIRARSFNFYVHLKPLGFIIQNTPMITLNMQRHILFVEPTQ